MERTIECPYCEKRFADQNGVYLHAKAKHKKEKTAHLRPPKDDDDDGMVGVFRAMDELRKERKIERINQIDATIQKLTDTGAQVVLLSDLAHHYRVTSSKGVQYDFWASTARWLRTGTNRGGGGLPSLIRAISYSEQRSAGA